MDIQAAEAKRRDLLLVASHAWRLIDLIMGSETNDVLTHGKIPGRVYR